jgi:HEAT repeat protein
LRVIPKTIVPALVRAMDDTDLMVQRRAVGIMWAMGPHGDVAIPKLIQLIEAPNTDEELGWLALKCLGKIGPKARETIPLLLRVVEGSGKTMHRQGAADSLALLGKGDKRVVPALVRVLNSPTPARVQGNAAAALGHLAQDPHLSIPALISLIRRSKGVGPVENDPRHPAVLALGSFGPDGGDAVPTLIELARDDSPWCSDFRRQAIIALGRLGRTAKAAVPVLTEIQRSGGLAAGGHVDEALNKIQSGR